MSNELTESTNNAITKDILSNPSLMQAMVSFADIMSKSRTVVPQHLRGNVSDCLAVAMQAQRWGMDPFAVASKTYQVMPGAPIAYEAQCINAAIIANAPILARPEYEYVGDWSKVQGKILIKKSQKGKDYAAPAWEQEDEKGLGVIVKLHVRGEENPRELLVEMAQCWPRNSTNWTNNPKQQLAYSAIRMIARRDFPDVLMGIYTVDEVETIDVTPERVETVDDLIPEKDKEEPADTSKVDKYKTDIKRARSVNRLKTIGNQLKNESADVQDEVRGTYTAKLDKLRPPPAKESVVDADTGEIMEGAETTTKNTGENEELIDLQQIQAIVDDADSVETLIEARSMLRKHDLSNPGVSGLDGLIDVRMNEIEESLQK